MKYLMYRESFLTPFRTGFITHYITVLNTAVKKGPFTLEFRMKMTERFENDEQTINLL